MARCGQPFRIEDQNGNPLSGFLEGSCLGGTLNVDSSGEVTSYRTERGDSCNITAYNISRTVSQTKPFTACTTKITFVLDLTSTLNCTSTPPGAQIFLDGQNTMQYTPHTLTGIAAGSHRIDYYLTDHDTCGVNVNVPAGGTVNAVCTLPGLTGTLNCTSNPTGVSITIGTTNYGLTNRDITLDVGNYDVKYSKAGYEDYTKSITVNANQTTYMSWTMVPISGNINCNSTPPGAQIFLDGNNTMQYTPHLLTDISPGSHRIDYYLTDHFPCGVDVTVPAGGTAQASCTLTEIPPPEVPGFDINVNIPGLLPNSSLYVFEVDKIPFTDTWWDSPFGSGMKWDNISNGLFKARELRADCDPDPASHQSLRPGQDYVIYVGTSAISLYPSSLVHNLTNGTTSINITDSYVDWLSTTLCSAFDISPVQCSNFIFTSVNDAAFLLEQWKIITEHKNLAGENVTPTALDYALIPIAIFGMFSPGISEGAISAMVGKRFGKLIELSKKGTIDVKEIAQDPRLSTFMLRATDSQFKDLIIHLEEGYIDTAKILLGIVDNITPTNLELNSLDRAVKLTQKTDQSLTKSNSIENLPTVLSKFSPKFKEVFRNALNWVTEHPHDSVVVGAAGTVIVGLLYVLDKMTGNIDSSFKADGITMSSTSWGGKDYVNIIDTYRYNVQDAERLGNWALFCENLLLWNQQVDGFEAFVSANQAKLNVEGYYDIFTDTIAVYRKAIELKNEVHPCWEEPLPESFEAEVTEIIDADTVKINYEGKEHDVRFLGINTPEGKSYDYTCTSLREPFLVRRLITPGKECIEEETWNVDEPLFNSTKEWLAIQIPVHQIATFRSDLTRQFDDYGRLLAVPFYNSKNICIESLKAGQSVVFFYDENKQVNQRDFLAAEKIASDANIGVWPFAAGTGWIKFISDPTATEVYLDGIKIGNTVSKFLLWETTLGSHSYEFKKVGYIGCNGTIEINETHTETNPIEKDCTLTLEEPPCPNPNASFAVSTTSPEVGESVSFNATASSPGAGESISSYQWDFGDGTTATGMIVSHTFATAGLFVVKLDVRNSCGNYDPAPATKSITVSEATVNPAIWEIGNATDPSGNILSAAKVFVDTAYIGHYAPETLKFCPGCSCDTVVQCDFGEHTVTVKKTGYKDWNNTRTLNSGDLFTDNPVLEKAFEVEIMSIPEGVTIIVDGEPITTTLNLIEQILMEK